MRLRFLQQKTEENTPLDGLPRSASLYPMKSTALLRRYDLAAPRELFKKAAARSRAWNKAVHRAIAKYGDRPSGGYISGIYSYHFPEHVKNGLRNLAHAVTEYNDAARAARPKRIRGETIEALRVAVRSQYGGGFYG